MFSQHTPPTASPHRSPVGARAARRTRLALLIAALLLAAALFLSPIAAYAQDGAPPAAADTSEGVIEPVDGTVVDSPLPPIKVNVPLFLPVVVR